MDEEDECHSEEGTAAFSVCPGPSYDRKAQKVAESSYIDINEYKKIIKTFHPGKGAWYDKFYARTLARMVPKYEGLAAGTKQELFDKLNDSVKYVLDLGVGTGPNLKYYGNRPGIQKVIGVDPNLEMAKFCSSEALKAGLSESQFEFVHGVGEVIPLPDASVDAVVCTHVLCSVSNVASTLKEVKRVLKPGGAFIFVEHVAAYEGKWLPFWQKILGPLQQLFADGCHLQRDTLQDIRSAKFRDVEAKKISFPGLFVFSPHIAGVAHNAQNDI